METSSFLEPTTPLFRLPQFAKRFGAVADRFGVGWMIIVEP